MDEQQENAYWPIGSIRGNLYIGTGAGKHLLMAVQKAKVSIKICSPYISPSLLSLLLDKEDDNVQVQCITQQIGTDAADKFGLKDTCTRLLKSHLHIDKEQEKLKERILKQARKSKVIGICFLGCSFVYWLLHIFFGGLTLPESTEESFWIFVSNFSVLIILSIYFFRKENQQVRYAQTINIWEYRYSFTKDLCLLKRDCEKFPHLKLVIVDEKVAYLGSLNFTCSGIKSHIESCIRIGNEEDQENQENQENVKALINCFDKLWQYCRKDSLSATVLGKYYSKELNP